MPASNRATSPAAPPLPRRLRLRAALLLVGAGVLCAVACDSNLACPQGFNALGSFNVGFTSVDAGAACMINKMTDGGPADASLIGQPDSKLMLLCAAQNDGGLSLSYSFRGTGTHTVDLDGGVFAQANTGTGQTGSACLCPLDLTETITGTLRTADGGAFAVEADGGFSPVIGITGTLAEAISASSSSSSCACTLPCVAGFTYTSQ